ncbi:MAG: hypothetical protein M1812_006396 [Candelaria pacifica]|nr:MAG: hypothetical protein M1812_006396 [Candelaria pacifica]
MARTAESKPERASSNSRMLKLLSGSSLKKRRGKDEKTPSPRTPGFPMNIPIVTAELDGGIETELPASLPASNSNRSDVDPTRVYDEDIEQVVTDLSGYLERFTFLHKSCLGDPSRAYQDTAVQNELENLDSKTLRLCQHFRDRASLFPLYASARKHVMFEEGADVIIRCLAEKTTFRDALCHQMEKNYLIIMPGASDFETHMAFNSRQSKDLTLSPLRNDPRFQVQTALQIIESRFEVIQTTDEWLSKTGTIYGDLKTSLSSDISPQQESQDREPERIDVAPLGDITLDFGATHQDRPWLRYRVSSQLLAVSSPLFARALNWSRSLRIPVPADLVEALPPEFVGELPTAAPVPMPDTATALVYMPQVEENDSGSLTTLLHAAHMRIEAVPRKIGFREFVDIAKVCYRYKCISPIAIFVECYWLPQWRNCVGKPGYEDLLFISYVFGISDVFEQTTKLAILQLRGTPELLQDRLLPHTVKQRISSARATEMSRILKYCKETMNTYLPTAAAQPGSAINSETRPDNEPQQLQRPTRCPQGYHHCDATNLGMLMLSYNEVGCLYPILDPADNTARQLWHTLSLDALLSRLRAIPSAVAVHPHGDTDSVRSEGCDYAPQLIDYMTALHSSIRGLELEEVNTDYARGQDTSLTSHERMPNSAWDGDTLEVNSPTIEPENPSSAPLSPNAIVPDVPSRQASNSRSEYTSSSGTAAYAETVLTEYSDQHHQSQLNEGSLARLNAETVSIISTEVDIRTDRGRCDSPSPSITTLGTNIGRPLHFGLSDVAPPRATVSNSTAVSERDTPGNKEDEKIYWAHKAHKEILTRADKERIVSHKHTMRLADERGLPLRSENSEGESAETV